jgi:hypothetical protein
MCMAVCMYVVVASEGEDQEAALRWNMPLLLIIVIMQANTHNQSAITNNRHTASTDQRTY